MAQRLITIQEKKEIVDRGNINCCSIRRSVGCFDVRQSVFV